MSDEALLDALVERFLPECEESLKRIRETRERLDALSDDEWWEGTTGRLSAANPAFAERLEERKTEMIRQRHARTDAFGTVDAHALARQKAENILPALLRVRRLRRATGPITENQIHAASMAASLAEISGMRTRIKEAAERTTDPKRQRILEMLSGNVLADLGALRSLARPGVSEKRLESVAKEISRRFQGLTEAIGDEPRP